MKNKTYFSFILLLINGLSADSFAQSGQLDDTFGGRELMVPVGSANDESYAVAIQSDGKIVLVGSTNDGIKKNFAVFRYGSSLATGIEPLVSQGGKIFVYPNPCNGIFTIKAECPEFERGEVRIYNAYGERIHSNVFASGNTMIDISVQPNGIYFLQVLGKEGSAAQKIIIRE